MMAKDIVQFRIEFDLGAARQIGPDKIALLQAIGRERSIAAAATAGLCCDLTGGR